MQIGASRRDFLWNFGGTFFRMGSSFLLLPFLLAFLGDDELGLWYVFLAVSSFVTLFQAGFAPTFARNVAYCWSGARALSKRGVVRSGEGGEINWGLRSRVVAARHLV